MDDMLKQVFSIHSDFVSKLPDNEFSKEELTEKLLLACQRELWEVHDELNWKWWKKDKKIISEDKIVEELIDSFCFIIELLLLWGHTADSAFQLYTSKMKKNYLRFIPEESYTLLESTNEHE